MPLVRVSSIGGKLSPEKKKKICQEMHDVMMRNTQSPSEAVWVIIDEVATENWMIHEPMLSEKSPREIFEKE